MSDTKYATLPNSVPFLITDAPEELTFPVGANMQKLGKI